MDIIYIIVIHCETYTTAIYRIIICVYSRKIPLE